MRIKICGITNIDDALCVVRHGAHAIGFVFYKNSERYISPESVKKIVGELPPFIERVGVFVDETPSEIDKICSYCNLSLAQLHNEMLNPADIKTKSIRVVRAQNRDDVTKYANEMRLVDAHVEQYGGEGKRLNLDWFKDVDCSKIIIAGGITPDNVWELGVLPFFGVDVSSGVEEFRGKKSCELVTKFIKNAKVLCADGSNPAQKAFIV